MQAQGVRLHVEQHGSGPAIVFLHGFGGSARNFRPQIKAFEAAHRVTSFDARGHARSEAPTDARAYEPEHFVEDLARVVDLTGEQRVVLAGLSMGAGIALRYAIVHSARVRALVLASFPRARDDAAHRQWALAFADAIEKRGIDAAGAEFAWGTRSHFDPRSAALIRQGFLEHSSHALAFTLRKVIAEQPSSTDLALELGALTVPTLLIAGSEDQGALVASQALASKLDGARVAVIEGAGHVVNLAAPERFNALLGELLSNLPHMTS